MTAAAAMAMATVQAVIVSQSMTCSKCADCAAASGSLGCALT